MTKSMTEGKTFPLILQFALPLLVGNLLQQTYNIIDAAIVGRILGTEALASVGASSSVQFLVIGFCMGICCGFGVPIAQKFGAGNQKEMRNSMFHAMVLTGVFAVILTTGCALLCPQILHLLSTPENIFSGAYQYLLVLFLGIPFTLLYNLLASILRAVGDSKTPFILLAFSTILNIFLDLFCILVLKWGCAGAAIATITAQAVSGILCLVFMWKKIPELRLKKEDLQIQKDGIKTMLWMGIPMGMQYSITAIGSMVMQSANNGLGSIYVSGFTAGMRIKQFVMCPFDAFATAVSVFCGQNLGAGKIDRIKKGIRQGVAMGVIYGLCAGLVLIFAGRTLSMLFVSAKAADVLDASAKYLRCMGFFFWSLGILNICRMTVQGLGFSGRAVFSGVTEMIARIVVSLVFVPLFGYSAICFADQTAWVSACLYIVPTCMSCVKKIRG
ncbi:MAG: MATE family efflux transporter [Lachnospiraceae bacterium]